MILEAPHTTTDELARRTGWEIKPEGACKGERCVPLPDLDGDRVPVEVLTERLGMGLARDERHGLWALGPEAGGPALSSAEAPDFELPDRDGNPFRLSSLRGSRVVMVAWASW